jgi:hypothetical protein
VPRGLLRFLRASASEDPNSFSEWLRASFGARSLPSIVEAGFRFDSGLHNLRKPETHSVFDLRPETSMLETDLAGVTFRLISACARLA